MIFTMLLPAAAYGYYTEDTRYATTSVNVRSGPGTKYSIVGGLNRGDIVKRTGESGKWIEVEGPQGRQRILFDEIIAAVTDSAKG